MTSFWLHAALILFGFGYGLGMGYYITCQVLAPVLADLQGNTTPRK